MTTLEKKQLIGSWKNGQVNEAYLEPSAPPLGITTPSTQSAGSGEPSDGLIPLQDSGLVESSGVSERKRILPPPETEEKGRINSFEAFVHIVRCHAGSGLLGAARAVNYAGLVVGFFLFIASGFLVLTGMHLILSCARRLGERSASIFFSALLQFGVCAFFFVVVGDGVKQLFDDFLDIHLDVRIYMVVMLVLLIGPAFVKRLDILAIFSGIANVLFGTCLLIALGYIVPGLPPITTRPAYTSVWSVPMFLGQALMALEGIAVIVPVQNKMKKPEKFSSIFGVLNLGLSFVICLMTVLGCLGYWKYGLDTKTNILLNLPADQWLCLAAKIMMPLSILMTYPIQFYFIFVMIWPPVADRIQSPWLLGNGEYIQRMITLVLTFACAAFVPHLDLLMALFGSTCATFLGFIIPATADIVSRTSEGDRITVLHLVKDVMYIIFGIFIFLSGSYLAMKSIIDTF
ncbi:proton-coupled amino acid transporter-like protein CG1139 [Liolophura sinensis]|uniref:proton-coupled amino acid transporter-like protein CG1139 n=1 Tax=Liolophura sinensis TaxID=3198878 RepID=UPI00315980EC